MASTPTAWFVARVSSPADGAPNGQRSTAWPRRTSASTTRGAPSSSTKCSQKTWQTPCSCSARPTSATPRVYTSRSMPASRPPSCDDVHSARGSPLTSAAGVVAAVDLGASSGRVMLGRVGPNELSLHPVARFGNDPVRTIDGLHWNILELYRQVLGGMRSALRDEPGLRSAAVDSWAVDYALLRGDAMLANPYHYRDQRTGAGVAQAHGLVSPAQLYARHGLQFLPFNTLYQLTADRLAGNLQGADSMLLIPDLLTYWLTGAKIAERTNASTTG